MATMELGGDDVRRAAAAASATLTSLAGADWTVPARDLEMSARQTIEHVIEGLAFYARDLATPLPGEPDGPELQMHPAPDTPVPALIEGMTQHAAVVARVVEATPEDLRAFHPLGMADRSGFAAMACDEILVHTYDIAAGLGGDFDPPAELCEGVVARLFPWVPPGGAAWDRLRWANGRIELGDRPRLDRWRWHCAPLDEWDGTDPTG